MMWQVFLVSKKIISMTSLLLLLLLLFFFFFFIEVFVLFFFFFFFVKKHKKGSQVFTGSVLLMHCVMEWDHQNTNRVYHLLNPQFLELQVWGHKDFLVLNYLYWWFIICFLRCFTFQVMLYTQKFDNIFHTNWVGKFLLVLIWARYWYHFFTYY